MVSTPRYLSYMHMVKIHQQYLENWWCGGAGNNRTDIKWPKMAQNAHVVKIFEMLQCPYQVC